MGSDKQRTERLLEMWEAGEKMMKEDNFLSTLLFNALLNYARSRWGLTRRTAADYAELTYQRLSSQYGALSPTTSSSPDPPNENGSEKS